ncbi:hypothetical protein K7432_015520, partial [Basidiobolus ranarum]
KKSPKGKGNPFLGVLLSRSFPPIPMSPIFGLNLGLKLITGLNSTGTAPPISRIGDDVTEPRRTTPNTAINWQICIV